FDDQADQRVALAGAADPVQPGPFRMALGDRAQSRDQLVRAGEAVVVGHRVQFSGQPGRYYRVGRGGQVGGHGGKVFRAPDRAGGPGWRFQPSSAISASVSPASRSTSAVSAPSRGGSRGGTTESDSRTGLRGSR